jgi:hypothetical protein
VEALIAFFALRPVFTFWGIKVVWYLYLLNTVYRLYISLAEVSQLLAQRHISWLTWSPNSLPLLLGIVSQVAIARLLIEVAASILLTRQGRLDGA